ncbi:MAG: cell cycle protein [Flaviaesturariibacter sp.]|nr:cell cycle protein [Flaviaesturariibacter sp.]
MAQQTIKRRGRSVERIALLLIAIVLGALFYNLYTVLQRDFATVPQRLADGTIVNLNSDNVDKRLKALLEKGYYFEDRRDVDVVARAVAKGLVANETKIDNIGELNKLRYSVSAEEAFAKGGESFQRRARLSRSLIGFSDVDSNRYAQEKLASPSLPSAVSLNLGKYAIEGNINNRTDAPIAGVLMRLEMVLPQDSVYSEEVLDVDHLKVEASPTLRKTYALDEKGRRQLLSLFAYARTDAKGHYSFTGLPSNEAFQVLPLQPGFQFGSSKGVQELSKEVTFDFTQTPHTLRLFSSKDFNNLKREGSLIVRTPEEATKWYWIIAGTFFFGFLLLHLFLSFKLPAADQLILPVVMLLTGLSLISLLSLQDPLRDRFLAKSTLYYFGIGIVGMMVLLLFDFRRFTTDSKLYRLFAFKGERGGQGWQWGGLAIILLFLTILLGSGPEGSGVKVNLFGFQPSEIVKFLTVVFLAGFFAANEKFISEYTTFRKRWSFFYIALGAILLAIFFFLVLGDLGPAIVVCFTFIILFSFSRGDFAYMAGAVVLFVIANWVLKNVWLATGVTALVLVLSMLFHRKQASESAIMALVVIAGFLLLDQLPLLDKLIPGPVQRLTDRKAIWQNAWDNEVFGGDQVANGIWAMSSGGITGQGVGEGFAKTIPEAHTDMILPSIGEEFGWAGIITIFILFLLFLHRAIIIGRHTGRPFLFYLCAGIGIATFVQFLLIAGGSTGALPLSGVSLPFVSYGGSSLVCNMLAAGFLLSSSLVKGSAVQMNFISKQQDRNLVPALIAACAGLLLLGVNVSRYLFNNEKWVVQPALVAERSGARMFSYNPRIAILMNRLQAGNLFDRNGALLATSKPELIRQQRDSLLKAGLAYDKLLSLSRKRLDRYYPFGEHLFFWTGDANTGVFTGGLNGYFAEYELGPELRGFNTPITNYNVTASRFKEDRFLPQTAREMTVGRRDYSALASLLLAGINSPEVEAFKQRNRDVQLAVDASLQTALQKALQVSDSLQDNRVSVVIMEDNTGDVLASAANVLPPVNDWETLTMTNREQRRYPGWLALQDLGFTYATQPGSTAKLATALAAFNKLGESAAQKTFLIRQQDLIRIKSAEPDEAGNIGMERAIVKSNNSYFIKLANEERLPEEMATVYTQTGMFLRGVGGYYFEGNANNSSQEEEWRKLWRATEFKSVNRYNKNDIRRTRGQGVSGMAWGQGELIATPASVARLAAGIANNGLLVPNRYVLKISDSALGVKGGILLAKQPSYAQDLTRFMKAQSAGKADKLHLTVAGKTGTPERIWKGRRINDGWYVFFVPKATGRGHIVTCIRIEATKGSSDAVKLAGDIVIPELLKRGYIKSFESASGRKDTVIRAINNRPVPEELQ